MKQIKVEYSYSKFEVSENKWYSVSRNYDGTYDLDYHDTSDKYMIIEPILENKKRLSTINRYLKQKGYEIEFIDA